MSDLNALTLEPGEVVGGYTLISRLGSGAMGSVWRVRDGGGQVYAMKILRDSLSDDDAGAGSGGVQQDPNLKENVTARERLRREAMALKRVNHPGVCGIVDMELDDALAFIVTELIEGRNLRDDVTVNGRYVGDDLERLARKLIEAVKAVHAAGIVHRDIKPTNVMISATGPILVDFGIAMGEGESHVTRTGLVMGTPGFIAPEIIEGAESDESTDWWSVASVLAFAAMGEPVFGTKPMMAVLEREASGNANLAGLPAHTLTAFRSALNPEPTKRCTPDQLLHAIALDALNPLTSGPLGASTLPGGGLGNTGNGGNTGGTGTGNGVMPPFGRDDGHDDGDAVSTRTLWPGASADTNATAVLGDTGSNALAATRALTPDQCTVALPSDRLGPDDIPGLLCPPPPPGSREATDGAAEEPTGNPAARPVLRRIANNANQSPESVMSTREPRVAQSGQFAQVRPARTASRTAAGSGVGSVSGFPAAASPTSGVDVPPAYVPAANTKASSSGRADATDARDDDATATQLLPPNPPSAQDGPTSGRPQRTTVMPQNMPGSGEYTQRTGPRVDQRTSVMPPIRLHPGQQPVPQPEPLFPPRSAQTAQTQPVQPQSAADLERTTAIRGTVPEFLRTPPQGMPPAVSPDGRAFDDEDDYDPDDPYDSETPRNPRDDRNTGQPGHANAADLLRDQYLSHGTLPLVVMAVIPAIAAMIWPVAGLIAAAALFWMLFTVGYSDTAQLDRESRRGGERKGSDGALRLIQLPWHLTKGLLAAIARTAQFALIDVLCMVFAAVTLPLPWTQVPTPGGYWPYQMPWLADDGAFTATSLVAGGLAAVVWILVALWPYSATLRLAAGAMRGRSSD